MTNIELQTMEAVKRAANVIANKQVDWEQRRYELVKAAVSGIASNNIVKIDYAARKAVRIADEIINILKNE